MSEINIVELLVQGGALAALVVVLYLVAKHGSEFMKQMLELLRGFINAQNDVAVNLKSLCEHLDDCEARVQEQGSGTAKVLAELSRQLQAHEERQQGRYEQQSAHADARHAEMIGILKGLNGTR